MKFWFKKRQDRVLETGALGRAMQRKVAVCAAEAAVISVVVHLLFIFFAGSLVVLSVVLGPAAAFKGEKIERVKPERRAAELPVTLQELQKQGPRPKVASRMVSAVAQPFTLPSMTLPETSYKIADQGEAPQSLSSHGMPANLDIGVIGVNFFGTRSKGEKIVFILDATKKMMEDAKGGYNTYKFAKDKIHALVDGMQAATLFNVMVYSDSNVDLFRPHPVPANQANRDALKDWLAPINSDPYKVGFVKSNYRPSVQYSSDIGTGARGWLKAVQAAMEQTADTIFVLCGGYGKQVAARKPGAGGGGASERPELSASDERALERYREEVKAVNEKARKAFDAENAARAAKGLPPKIVYDWNDYMEHELRLVLPDRPTLSGNGRGDGGPPQSQQALVLNHMDAIWSYHYIPQELVAPRVNFVYLIARDAHLNDDYLEIEALKRTADAFRGDFEFLRGEKTMKNLIRYNSKF